MAAILENERHLYNAALQERIGAWRRGVSIGINDQTKSLTEIRSFDREYGSLPYTLSKWTLWRLKGAFAAFYRRAQAGGAPGFPRFKTKSRWSSFGFHQAVGLRLIGRKLHFKGLTGGLKVHLHRPLPEGAVIKSAAFTRRGRRWTVALTVEVATCNDFVQVASPVGVDVGIEALATLSTGERFDNLRLERRHEREVRGAARALARCQRGSKRRAKVRERLARAKARIARTRTNHLHQVSAAIARTHDLIAVEDLKLRNMTRSARGSVDAPGVNVRQKAGLNRALADAAPGRLIAMLSYKAERAGGRLIKVRPHGTSQECSSCGETVPKSLGERRHVCACGADLHRDHNAALNILARGLAAHAAGSGRGEPNVADGGERAPGNAERLAA